MFVLLLLSNNTVFEFIVFFISYPVFIIDAYGDEMIINLSIKRLYLLKSTAILPSSD